jgi:hypothetical protein
MIVSIAIASLLMFLINQLFMETTRAVSRGIAVSNIITTNRALGSQIQLDSDAMIGPTMDTTNPVNPATLGSIPLAINPDQGGFMVILQKMYGDTSAVAPLGRLNGDTDGNDIIDPGESAANGEGVPVTYVSGANPTVGVFRSDQILFVRYAGDPNSIKLNPLTPRSDTTFENDLTADYALTWYGHVLKTRPSGGDVSAGTPDLGNGDNLLANNWVLGRQLLFLVTDFDAVTVGDNPPGASDVYLNGAFSDSTAVQHWTPPSALPGETTVSDHRYGGVTDVTRCALSNTALAGVPYILTNSATDVGNNILEAITDDSGPEYHEAAYKYIFGMNRLRANMTPNFDMNISDRAYQPWQLAQMHPFLAEHVTNFIVEWAGDLHTDDSVNGTPDTKIDVHGGFSANVDSYGRSYSEIPANGVRWYTAERFVNYPGGPNGYNSLQPLTFAAFPSGFYPYEANPQIGGTDLANANAAFVWRHDDDAAATCRWPYLIRIRYQISDARGRAGIWFEQVIKVPRP